MRLFKTVLAGGVLVLTSCSSATWAHLVARSGRNVADSPSVDIRRAHCLDRARDHARSYAQNRAWAGFWFSSSSLALGTAATTGALYDRDESQKALRTTSAIALGLGITTLVSAAVPVLVAVVESDAANEKSRAGVRLIVLDEELERLKKQAETLSELEGTQPTSELHPGAAKQAVFNAERSVLRANASFERAQRAVAEARNDPKQKADIENAEAARRAAEYDVVAAQAVRKAAEVAQQGAAGASDAAQQADLKLKETAVKVAGARFMAAATGVVTAKADLTEKEALLDQAKDELAEAEAAGIAAKANLETTRALALNRAKQDYTRLRLEAAFLPCSAQQEVASVSDEGQATRINDAWCEIQIKECELSLNESCDKDTLCKQLPASPGAARRASSDPK